MKMLSDLEYVSVAKTKARLSEKLRGVDANSRRYAITSHGRPMAVLISYKEYLALSQNKSLDEPQKISLTEWKKGRSERRQVVDSIASLFDETKLTRKGQKGYKKNAVEKMGKIKR